MLRRTFLSSAAGGSLASRLSAASTPRVKLRVCAVPYLPMAPFYLAVESGYFAEAGFDLEIDKVSNTTRSIPLLAGGKLDVAFQGLTPSFINAVAQGATLKIVAARESASRACGGFGRVYVRSQAFPNGLRDLKPLKGKRIAYNGLMQKFVLEMLLANAGLRPEDVDSTSMEAPQCVAALKSGAADGYVSQSSDAHQMMDLFQFAPGPCLADVLPNHQFAFVIFGRDLLNGEVAIGARLLRVYLRATAEYLQGKTPNAFFEELAAANKVDVARLRGECRDFLVKDGHIQLPDVERVIRWSVDRKYSSQPVAASTLVDMRFLEALKK